jgi:hypothetical protein
MRSVTQIFLKGLKRPGNAWKRSSVNYNNILIVWRWSGLKQRQFGYILLWDEMRRVFSNRNLEFNGWICGTKTQSSFLKLWFNSRSRISSIQRGQRLVQQEDIKQEIIDYYQRLWSRSLAQQPIDMENIENLITKKINSEQQVELVKEQKRSKMPSFLLRMARLQGQMASMHASLRRLGGW